ncbi:hypothetical protein K0U83_10175 [bacterium]|nr:hypothetical protein [bacterium]
MADQKVTYEIRLKDLMSKTLRGLSKRVRKFAQNIRTGLVKAMQMAVKAIKGMAVAAAGAAVAIGFAAVRMGQSFLDAASSAEQVQFKFRTVFKELEGEARGMAESIATSMGRNQTEIEGFMANLQDSLVPLGFAREDAMELGAGFTQLGIDLAAMNKLAGGTDEAMTRLKGALMGAHENVEIFGVKILETTLNSKLMEMGVEKVNGAFREQDKVLARAQIIIEGTADAHGAAALQSESLAEQSARLSSQITGLREEMGLRLKTALGEAVKNFGGVDAIVNAARLTFEFLTRVLTEVLIPAVTGVAQNFVRFVEGMGGVEASVLAVSETVTMLGKVFQLMWTSVKLVFALFLQGIDTISFAVKAAWDIVKVLTGLVGLGLVSAFRLATEAVGLLFQGLDAVVMFIKDTAISVFQALINTVADVVDSIGDALVALGEYAIVPEFVRDAGKAAQEASVGMREFSASTEDLKGGSTWIGEMGAALDEFGDKLGPAQAVLKRFVEESFDELTRHGTEFVDAIMEDVPAINELYAAVRDGAQGIGTDYEALAAKAQAAVDAMANIEISSPEAADQAAAYAASLERIAGALGLMADKQKEAAASGEEVAASLGGITGGVESFMERIPDMQESLAGITEGAITSFGNGLTDAFVSIIDGSKSAAEAFKDFASKFLIDIGRMIIQTLIFNAISAAFGGFGFANGGTVEGGTGELTPLANGGVVSGGLGRALPVKGYANGGPIVNKPHVALIGEGKYNEAVVPLPDGRSIPVEMQGGGGANVTVEINAVDARSVDMLFRERKDTLTDIIRNAISQSRQFRSAVGGA